MDRGNGNNSLDKSRRLPSICITPKPGRCHNKHVTLLGCRGGLTSLVFKCAATAAADAVVPWALTGILISGLCQCNFRGVGIFDCRHRDRIKCVRQYSIPKIAELLSSIPDGQGVRYSALCPGWFWSYLIISS